MCNMTCIHQSVLLNLVPLGYETYADAHFEFSISKYFCNLPSSDSVLVYLFMIVQKALNKSQFIIIHFI